MDFNYLSHTQLATLILGIVFSVFAVAAVFFAYKNADRLKSKAIVCILTMIMPFIAITCWLILIFSFVDGFKNDDVFNIFVSLAISLVACFMILFVANALYQKHKKELDQKEEMAKAASAMENITEVLPAEEKVEDVTEEGNKTEVAETEVEDTETEEIVEEVFTPDEEVEDTTALKESTDDTEKAEDETTDDDEEPANFWLSTDDDE